jgi:hypothetical protein
MSTSGISSSDISSIIGVGISLGFVVDDGDGSLVLFDLRILIFFERFGDRSESKFKRNSSCPADQNKTYTCRCG